MFVETCDACKADLRGKPISPEHFVHEDNCSSPETCFCLPYGDMPEEERFFSLVVGVEVHGVYDGVLFYQCPACGHRWHRFGSTAGRLYREACVWVNASLTGRSCG